jgi:aminopeptidase N
MTIRTVLILCVLLFSACTAAGGRHPASGSEHGTSRAAEVEEPQELKGEEKQVEAKKDVKPIIQSATVDLSELKTLAAVIGKVSGRKIVYVGEFHDHYSHHAVQLEVIKGLHAKNPKIAVGMEMFQRPFQQVLDEYIGASIDEREFLKRSEYFKRWVFDYNLYKPILDFCREQKLPVVALNVRRELTEKVSKGGVDSLTEEERREIPAEMDLTDQEYRVRLKEVFERHGNAEAKSFDYFFQAQVLWDEAMARSVDEYLNGRPDHQMVVLAGGGHLAHGSGIPKRVHRRNGRDYAIVLNDVDVEEGIADYLVFPPRQEGASSPKLMALLKEQDGKVTVSGFTRGSVSEKAGLRRGDVILSMDGETVRNMGDIRSVLFYRKKGEALVVKALRPRFLLKNREVLVEVKL